MAAATAPLQCTPSTSKYHNAYITSSPQETQHSASPAHRASTQQFRFPGPSSRFHQRERASTNSRSNVTTRAVTPSFSTERRAHRRAHSSYTVPTVSTTTPASPYKSIHERSPRTGAHKRMHSSHARFTSTYSPASSEGRSPLSRYPSFASQAMATLSPGVVTPAKQPYTSSHDSPFSDYFTDDNRSIDEIASQDPPPFETQQLLVRLSKLQSTLMRGGNDSQALYLVGRRMSEIESDMDALHSQSRQPPELDDSGLFMEEAEDEAPEDSIIHTHKDSVHGTALDGTDDNPLSKFPPTPPASWPPQITNLHPDNVPLANQLSAIVRNLEKGQQELRQRHLEYIAERTRLEAELVIAKQQSRELRAERDLVLQDMKLDHADRLLLDCHLRRLESQVLATEKHPREAIIKVIDAIRKEGHSAMDKALKKRRRYTDDIVQTDDQFDEVIKQGSWTMDVVRHPSGRVDMMALKRSKSRSSDKPFVEINETTAEVVYQRGDVFYTDAGVQCDLDVGLLDGEEDLETTPSEIEDYDDDNDDILLPDQIAELRRRAREDETCSSECAITTSPSSEVGDSITNDDYDNNAATDSARSRVKSAWQELMNSMAELAGAPGW